MKPTPSQLQRYLGALLCIGVSGLFLYPTVRKVDLDEVRLALVGANLRWVIPMILISLVDFWIRAVRWQWVFPSHTRPKIGQAFSAFMIGALTNNIVPGRFGDVARAGMVARSLPTIGTSGALATVVLEKLTDGVILLTFFEYSVSHSSTTTMAGPDWRGSAQRSSSHYCWVQSY